MGWIHRDISFGNVLVAGGMAKITDFEYAKEILENEIHLGVRTVCVIPLPFLMITGSILVYAQGTPYFMSEEVRLVNYQYIPEPQQDEQSPQPTKTRRGDIWSEVKQEATALPHHMQNEKRKPSSSITLGPVPEEGEGPALPYPRGLIFRHNPLHDMESVLWLSLFVLLVSECENELDDKGRRKYDPQNFQTFMDAQKALAWRLFCDRETRVHVMKDANYLAGQTAGLHPTVCSILNELSFMCTDLRRAFKDGEKNLEPDIDGRVSMDWTAVNRKLGQRIKNVMAILDGSPLFLLKDLSKRPRRIIKPKEVKEAEKRKNADTNSDEREPDSDQTKGRGGPRSRVQKVHQGDDISSSSTTQTPLPSLMTYLVDNYGSDPEEA